MPVDRIILERRFLSRVEALLQGDRWFRPVAVAISAALIAGSGLAIHLVIQSLKIKPAFRLPLTLWFLGLFLLLGYQSWRKKPAEEGTLDKLAGALGEYQRPIGGGLRRWAYRGFSGNHPYAIVSYLIPILLMTSMPFFLLEEVFKGRRAFASVDAVRLAFEVLALDQDRIDNRVLAQLSMDADARASAIEVLLQMKLFLLRGSGEERHLLRTMAGQDLVSGCSPRIAA